MAFWPVPSRLLPISSTYAPVTVTASATPHTKGPWTEIIASTADAATGFMLALPNNSGNNLNRATLLDVALGAAGSEVVLLENMVHGSTNAQSQWIPLPLPAGARVSARIQSVVVSHTLAVGVVPARAYSGAPRQTFGIAASYGADTANSTGTVVQTLTELVASTDRRTSRIGVSMGVALTGGGATATVSAAIKVGPSGSEVTVLSFQVETTSAETILWPQQTGLYDNWDVSIPAGSRISMVSDSAQASFTIHLYS